MALLPAPTLPDAGTRPAQLLAAVQVLIQSTIGFVVAVVIALGGTINAALVVAAEGFAMAVFVVIALVFVPRRQLEAFEVAFPDAEVDAANKLARERLVSQALRSRVKSLEADAQES